MRPIDSQWMSREFIISLDSLQEQEISYSYHKSIDKPQKYTSMSRWLESLDDYLLKCWVVNKPPLAYVARSHVAVKTHETYSATDYENVDQ